MLTFQELLACVFLEESLMSDRSLKVVDHEIEDWSDVILRIPSKLSQSCVLQESAPLDDMYDRLTHAPRSIIILAKYMAAAAM